MSAGRKIRVLHVTTRLNVGGIATQVLGYCGGLDRDRYDVLLVTGRVGRHEAEALEYLGGSPCTTHVIDELGRSVGGADAVAFLKLRRLVRDFRPDIVHTHAAKAGTLGRLAAVAARAPIRVHSFHGHVFHGYFSPLVSRGIVAFERGLGLMTSAVMVPGASQRAEIGERFRIVPLAKIHVAPYGVDAATVRPREHRDVLRRRFGLTARFVIGALGRMAPIKNQTLLIKAFASLRRSASAPDVQLLLVGDGECREALERQAADLQLGDAVRFRTWEPDLASVYGAIDILAVSSLNEGMPVAALEAMTAGVGVVSTAVGGVVDVIRDGETGWLVPSNDVSALASALSLALVDPRRPAIVERARAHVSERHSFVRACAELALVYEALLARSVRTAAADAAVVTPERNASAP